MKTSENPGRVATAWKSQLFHHGTKFRFKINHLQKMNVHNPPLSSEISKLSSTTWAAPDFSPLLAQIKAAHFRAHRGSVEFVTGAIECGLLLIQLQKQLQRGLWGRVLQSIDMPRTTAWHYMEAAKRSDGKVLKDGIYLCNLLREPDFALLPELNGGGRRLTWAQRQARQLVFHFDPLNPAIREVLGYKGAANPLLTVPEETFEQTRLFAERLVQWLREAGRGEIDV